MIKLIWRTISKWLKSLIGKEEIIYRTVYLEELPDDIDEHTIYILGEGPYLWSAAMLCPCGCGEMLHMSLHKDGHPRWHLNCHNDGTVTLTPSIWRRKGCCSHFFLQHGRIKWCK